MNRCISRISRTLGALAVALVIAGCASTSPPRDIGSAVAAKPEFSTLATLIKTAGLEDTLNSPGPYTVFAPTNEAFKAVPAKKLEELANDKEQLKAVLTYHVLNGKILAADVKNGNAKTLQGANVALSRSGTFVTIEDAVVTGPDISTGNGVIHAIDRVLIPPKKT